MHCCAVPKKPHEPQSLLAMPLSSVCGPMYEAAGGECCANAVRKVEEAPHSMSLIAVINSQHRQVWRPDDGSGGGGEGG